MYASQYCTDSFTDEALPNEVQVNEVEKQIEVDRTESTDQSLSEPEINAKSNFASEVGRSILRSAGRAVAVSIHKHT
jgi:hypothetical protein